MYINKLSVLEIICTNADDSVLTQEAVDTLISENPVDGDLEVAIKSAMNTQFGIDRDDVYIHCDSGNIQVMHGAFYGNWWVDNG